MGQAELIALEKQKGEEQQGGGGNQDQLALQAVGPEPETVLPEVVPGEKAQTAHEDEQRDGPPDQRVAYIAGQGGVGSAGPHQVKAGVAESGDGVEDPIP